MSVNQKIPVPMQDPNVRKNNFEEVCIGYDLATAQLEANRCMKCKNAKCMVGCPVSINIPAFIAQISEGDVESAYKIISEKSCMSAICGRVCPQENQCEKYCVRGIKGDAVQIGKLERFVGDYAIENGLQTNATMDSKEQSVAVIGSGPASLSASYKLINYGYKVTVFEALHLLGGVLTYGIPEFRLPKDKIVNKQIDNLKNMGVKFMTNVVVGKTITINELLKEFSAVFIGTGAGLPKFMGIKGENAKGVFSANEFLTRTNLMRASYKEYDTPLYMGKKVAVIGGGNVAMDCARTAIRLGASVMIVYRRGLDELPARREEIHHAMEEGVEFKLLSNPKEIVVDNEGNITHLACVKMQLVQKEGDGRLYPIEVPDSDFNINADMVILSLGTTPNPLISASTKGLNLNKYKCIEIDNEGRTNIEGVFAGGDAVSGSATVILAMRAGEIGADSIDKYIKDKHKIGK